MARSLLQITLQHGVWRVTLDGRFFGDYRSKSQAIESAEEARRAMAISGRITNVVVAAEQPQN
jgi:hypothetical protein